MLTRLDEMIPYRAILGNADSTAVVKIPMNNRYAEVEFRFSALANNKRVLGDDPDRNNILVKISNTKGESFIRNPADMMVVNGIAELPGAKYYLCGPYDMEVEFSFQRVATGILFDLEFPIECSVLAQFCYLTKEEYEQRLRSLV